MDKEKSLISNYIFNMLYTFLNIVFPLITIPYLSRVLLASGIGKVSFSQNIVTYFLVFAQMGIPKYGVREIAKVRKSKKDMNKTFNEIFSINFISTLIATIIYYYLIFHLEYFKNNIILMAVSGLILILNVINVDWFYTGIEEYKYITIRSFFVKICSLLLIFSLVRSQEDYILYAFIYCVAIGGNYIFNIIQIRKYVKLDLKSLNLTKHLKSIVVLLSTTIAVELYAQLDTTMVGMICGDSFVGYYTNSMKMTKVIVNVITAIGAILLPRLSYYYNNGDKEIFSRYINKALAIIICFSFASFCGLEILSKDIVYVLFGNNFEPSILTLRILGCLIPILAIGNLFGTQVLMIVNKEVYLMYTVIVGAIVNVILNIILIPLYQQNGAAIASVIAELFVMLTQIYFAKRFLRIFLSKKFIISTIVSCTIMSFAISICSINTLNSFLSLITSIFIGILSYVFTSLILKNEVTLFIVDILNKKLKLKK